MGGAAALGVAMETARTHPLGRMVLMGSAGLAVDNPDPAAKQALTFDFTREGMRKLMATHRWRPGYRIDEDLLDYLFLAATEPATTSGVAGHVRRAPPIPRKKSPRSKYRTLVVGGQLDRSAVLASHVSLSYTCSRTPGALSSPHCGHWVMMEALKVFVRHHRTASSRSVCRCRND